MIIVPEGDFREPEAGRDDGTRNPLESAVPFPDFSHTLFTAFTSNFFLYR